MPVSKAVIKNAVPAMLAMLMFLIYNLADAFFISQTHDVYQIAAISLTTPLFMMFSAFSTIFGGGFSVISRATGKQEKEYIKRVSSFCTWGAISVGVLIAIVFLTLGKPILYGLGASDDTYFFARSYLNVIAFCGPFIVVSGAFFKLLMAQYGDMALAGLEIASKVTMITSMVCVGLGQGVQPLFGFSNCYFVKTNGIKIKVD